MTFHKQLKGKFSLESKFTSAYLKAFREDGWAFKIPDIGRTIKPFDWFGVNHKGVIFCEAKVIEAETVKFSIFRDNQLTALERIYILSRKYGIDKIYPVLQIYSKKHNDYRFIHISVLLLAESKGETELILEF